MHLQLTRYQMTDPRQRRISRPPGCAGCLSGLQAVVMTFQVPVPKEPKEPKVMACALRSSCFFLMVFL